MRDVYLWIGLSCLAAGCWLYDVRLALIVVGALLLMAGVYGSLPRKTL